MGHKGIKTARCPQHVHVSEPLPACLLHITVQSPKTDMSWSNHSYCTLSYLSDISGLPNILKLSIKNPNSIIQSQVKDLTTYDCCDTKVYRNKRE